MVVACFTIVFFGRRGKANSNSGYMEIFVEKPEIIHYDAVGAVYVQPQFVFWLYGKALSQSANFSIEPFIITESPSPENNLSAIRTRQENVCHNIKR
jgi:hypothetical protein